MTHCAAVYGPKDMRDVRHCHDCTPPPYQNHLCHFSQVVQCNAGVECVVECNARAYGGATGQSGSSGKSGMHKVYSALALPCLALETQST